MSSIFVQIHTKQLQSQSIGRGIGMYTRLLTEALAQRKDITITDSTKEAQIVHFPYFDFFFSSLPILIKKRTVVTIHDVIPLIYPEQYKPGIKGSLRFLKQKVALKSVSAIITDSHISKLDINTYLAVPLEKIFVTPLAGNPELQPVAPRVVREIKEKYSLTTPYVLYVGDINYNKNINQLIKMLKYLPEEIHLVCVGRNFKHQEIPEWKKIVTQVAMSDVEDRVHYLSTIASSEELSALYTGAELYVQPSLYEGFGLPVLEAMQCKTIVVASDTAALKEVGGQYALYAKPNAEELANKVKEVLTWSQKKRQEWVTDAVAWAASFSWKKTAKLTVDVYRKVSL